MPIVIRYDDPSIVASLAGSAGMYATNRQSVADALQQQQLQQDQRNRDLALNLQVQQMNQRNAWEQQQLDLQRDQFAANEDQRGITNQIAWDRNRIADENRRLELQQAATAPQRNLDYQQQVADMRQRETEQDRQATIARNLEALQKMGLGKDYYDRAKPLVEGGMAPMDAVNKLQGIARNINADALDREKEARLAQGKPEDQAKAMHDAVDLATREVSLRSAALREYRQTHTTKTIAGDEFDGDPAELRRLEQASQEARNRAIQLMEGAGNAAPRMAGKAPAAPATQPSQPDQLAQSALYVAQKNGKDPRQIAQTLVQLHGLGKPSPQQVLQAAGGDLMLAADLADALGL